VFLVLDKYIMRCLVNRKETLWTCEEGRQDIKYEYEERND